MRQLNDSLEKIFMENIRKCDWLEKILKKSPLKSSKIMQIMKKLPVMYISCTL